MYAYQVKFPLRLLLQKVCCQLHRLLFHLLFLTFGNFAVRFGGKTVACAKTVRPCQPDKKLQIYRYHVVLLFYVKFFVSGTQGNDFVILRYRKGVAGNVAFQKGKAFSFLFGKHAQQLVTAKNRHPVAQKKALFLIGILRIGVGRGFKLHVIEKSRAVQFLLTACKGEQIAHRQRHVARLRFQFVGNRQRHAFKQGVALVEKILRTALATAHHGTAFETVRLDKVVGYAGKVHVNKAFAVHQQNALPQRRFLSAFFRNRLQSVGNRFAR